MLKRVLYFNTFMESSACRKLTEHKYYFFPDVVVCGMVALYIDEGTEFALSTFSLARITYICIYLISMQPSTFDHRMSSVFH
jgi:hypothetical protein